jgi:single-stranded-DNA-specific exonuclease
MDELTSAALDIRTHSTPTPVAAQPHPGFDREAIAFARALGMSATVGCYLYGRGFREVEATRRFLEPRLSTLSSPAKMADRDRASERLKAAISKHERICVFGDYDCDGITSAAIMSEILNALGADVVALLASRFDGGYGISHKAVERISATGASLLVTCDCGSSDREGLLELSSRGLEAIVIDHHLVPDEALPAVAFLNPNRPDCGFLYKGLASCGLALSIGAALRAALGRELDLRRWLDLVAIGTIADVAPLDGDNRALVRAGLAALRAGQRPGVRALLDQCGFDALVPLTSQDIAFRIAPRINAPGRLGDPRLAFELLTAQSIEEAREIATEVEQLSNQRRALQERMLAAAIAEIESERYAERAAIVIGQRDFNQGIVGIVAGRLAARFERPVIVIGFEGEHGRGSVRGPAGFRLYDALSAVKDTLIRFGGHQAAAGVEVSVARLGELRHQFEQVCATRSAELFSSPDRSKLEPVARYFPDDDPAQVLGDLGRLEPCGVTNPAPRIALSATLLAAREVRGGHLKLELELPNKQRLGGFAPDLGPQAATLPGSVEVVGRLRPDRWRGGQAVEMLVETIG